MRVAKTTAAKTPRATTAKKLETKATKVGVNIEDEHCLRGAISSSQCTKEATNCEDGSYTKDDGKLICELGWQLYKIPNPTPSKRKQHFERGSIHTSMNVGGLCPTNLRVTGPTCDSERDELSFNWSATSFMPLMRISLVVL